MTRRTLASYVTQFFSLACCDGSMRAFINLPFSSQVIKKLRISVISLSYSTSMFFVNLSNKLNKQRFA